MRRWILIGTAVPVAAIVAFVAAYFILFSGSSPPPLSLSTPQASVSPALTGSQLAGPWNIAGGSVAGYRVREQLAFLSAPSDAVGRTSSISGSLTLAGTSPALTVDSADFTVDVSTLSSDRPMRDDRIRDTGLQSAMYPRATFKLTSP